MLIHPNQTILEGIVTSFAPAVGGFGNDVEMEVVTNLTPDPQTDVVRPEIGSSLKLFAPRPEKMRVGKPVRVRVATVGDSQGERTVLQEVIKPAAKPAAKPTKKKAVRPD